MPCVKYRDHQFDAGSAALIKTCNGIIAEYLAQGFALTLRQLYYQLVSRAIIANRLREYKRLGSIINDARLAGLVDWLAIEDRTRNLQSLPHWATPGEIVEACSKQFRMDSWETQKFRPEVWIEKDALLGVIEGVCQEFDVPYFSCRGYTSASEMWMGAQRLLDHVEKGQTPVIFHLGDHDPSGKDMTRDILERMELFMGGIEVKRLALNMNQVDEFKPPPNPAKITDTRAAAYIAEFGDDSWELDALEPAVIAGVIRAAITGLIDRKTWTRRERDIKAARRLLKRTAEEISEKEE